jgi:ATP-dependent Lon protease
MELLQIIPIKDTVIFPESKFKVLVKEDLGKVLEKKFMQGVSLAIGSTVKQKKDNDYETDALYLTGTLLYLQKVLKSDQGYLVSGYAKEKIALHHIEEREDGIYCGYSVTPDIMDMNEKNQKEIADFIKSTVYDLSEHFQGSDNYITPLEKMDSINELIGYIIPHLNEDISKKQHILEIMSLHEKSMAFVDLLMRQKESIKLQIEMAQKFSKQKNKNYRETLLREQLKAIKEELRETTGEDPEKGYQEKIEESDMPEEVKKVAFKECDRLENSNAHNSEQDIIRNYLDTLLALPWTSDKKEIDINNAKAVLNGRHFGMEKVKERIIQHMAVMKLKEEKQGSIILLVGPPGTGKTSLGKSIAKALNRQYVRASLGGVRDEAEIRGHRRTYIGALPGRIIQSMKKAGEKNPVFILDEVDKLTSSAQGDPSSALLEVLDPEQNNSFSDHFLGVPYDLSEVFFIATANTVNTIPAPLLDRMEVIEVSSYTNQEKYVIGEDYLLPEILNEHGLTIDQLQVTKSGMEKIIDKYTKEAGVRGLKKQLSKVARVVSEKIVSGEAELPFIVDDANLYDVLGRELVRHEDTNESNSPGIVTGLAWTPVGGEILFIESTFMPGSGKLTLTGQLGDVMKESAQIAISLVRSRLADTVTHFKFEKNDIHIHVPSGATPKDGPSAGIALLSSLASLLTGKAVDSKLAMTGEVTLGGNVLPIGGVKEKVLAAHRAGITRIILPEENEKDLVDVPQEVKDSLTFIFVKNVEEVLQNTIGLDLPPQEWIIHGIGIENSNSQPVL